jgi:endonuclease/exonuclease/phosphatase (EEP) superfamily protein YafD
MDNILTCLFWNQNRLDRRDLLVRLAAETQADVIALAEPGFEEAGPTLEALRQAADPAFGAPPADTPRLHIFARRAALDLQEVFGDVRGRLTVRRLRFQETEFLLAAVHLPSKLYWNPEDQSAESGMLAQDLRRAEEQHRHRRTIVVGDLNMNPFEAGVVNASGLHAMMTRALVKDGSREVQGREYPFFYNPMWGFFGDRTPGPPGTYY